MSTLTRGTLTRPFSTNATTSLRPTLAGTVPSHRCYILLHTSCPPSRYNARVSSAVQRALQLKLLKLGAIVNFSWSPDQPVCPQEGAEAYYSTAFSTTRGRLEIPEVSIHNVDEVGEQLRNHIEGPSSSIQNKPDSDVHLYVCTHGARDCRCGNMGGMVVNALRKEVEKRNRENPLGPSRRLKVAEVGHVGGHKYAANLLVYPQGDWLGLLEPEDVPGLLDHILHINSSWSSHGPPILSPHWRGRMGLSKDEQIELQASFPK